MSPLITFLSKLKNIWHNRLQRLDSRLIRETKRMGTAGCISLIPDQVDVPMIVANSDILTKASLPQCYASTAREKRLSPAQ